ncbi:hypothetical protein KKE45_02670, partial [Patescibacteria group bacterium]|nr:hypothetical protein [Patescibacteria group bacterium]
MAERENDRNDRSMDQVFDEAKTEDAWRQKMRADFRELTNYIASPEVTDTSVVQSKLFAQLGLYAEVGNDPTQWETGPVMLALVEKAQADLLGTEHERELSEWDKKIAVFSVDNTVLESVLRKQAEALRYGNGAIVAYTAEEAVQLAEYSELLGNRDTILKMSGAGGLCEMINQGWQLNTQRNELRVEIVNAELRVGTAMDEDRWDRYDELVEISKGALSVGEKERYDELVAEEIRLKRKGRELGYRDKKRIEKFEKRMDDQLEEEGVLDEFCEFLDDSAIVSAIEDRRWVEDAKKGLVRLDNEIMVQDAKTEKQLEGKESAKWYELYRAFRGAADLIETTHGWEKNWTDLEQGAIKGFVESRWTKSYRPSDMVALLNLPGLGEAIEASFGAMAAVATGAGVLGSDGKRYADASRLPKGTSQVAVTNIFLQKDGFTEKQLQEDFFDPIRGFAEKASGSGLYARFATEVARQLFETSL